MTININKIFQIVIPIFKFVKEMIYTPKFQSGKKIFLQPNDPKLPIGRIHPFYYQPSSELASSIGGEKGEPAYLIPTFKFGEPLKDALSEFRKSNEHLGGPFKT